MIKLSFCLTKRDDLSIDEFYDYLDTDCRIRAKYVFALQRFFSLF